MSIPTKVDSKGVPAGSSTGLAADVGQVRKQIQLPFSKAWEISIKSIKIRLARSFITAGGIFLGIAFYSYVKAGTLFVASGNALDPAVIAAGHRQQWLAVMALMVCFVGIVNSMLMSVTERFKEIGTMKCLGALNRFIVTLFLIEAGLMGVLASFAGWLIGWVLVVVIHLFTDGLHAFGGAFWLGSGEQLLVSMGVGVLITLLAAVPPAYRVAQMPPAVALRSEI
jgi:putative ABC transport system permease protein